MRHIHISIIFIIFSLVTVVSAASAPSAFTSTLSRSPAGKIEKVKKNDQKKKLKKAKKKKKITKKKISKKKTKRNKKTKNGSNWSDTCANLLDSSVSSTIALEKKLQKKRKLTRDEFDEQVHNELLVVQLNAWVCAISSDKGKVGVALEEKFLKDYSTRVQGKQL